MKIERPGSPTIVSASAGLWDLYCANRADIGLRNRLVQQYLPLVSRIAGMVRAKLPNAIELGTLISAGTLGLMDAIEAFDPARGVKFETYSATRIRGAMLDDLRHSDFVPRLARAKGKRLQQAIGKLQQELGRQPHVEELAAALGISDREALNLAGYDPEFESLQRPLWIGDRPTQAADVIADRRAEQPDRRLAELDFMRLASRGLNRQERLVLLLYYYDSLTMKEIGATLNLSESRVSQMHSQLIGRLRKRLAVRSAIAGGALSRKFHQAGLTEEATTHGRYSH